MTKISVVIPVYNAEEFLEQCVGSVLAQTFTDVEVICVDDCSKDRSYEIMQELRNRDPRVKVFHFEEPKSALQARKTGVMAAEGKYILFLDADDFLELDACRKIWDKIEQEKVDILHFSSRVLNCANLPQGRIDSNQKMLTPYQGKLVGEAVFSGCFLEKKYFFTLWNKLLNAEVCKKAFSYMEDKYLPKAQDLYSFFIISFFSRSYYGWVSEPLHNYCLGRGVVGSSKMNLDKFERYCTQVNIVEVLRKFSAEQNILNKTEAIIQKYYEQWISECVKLWKNELPRELALQGWEVMCRYWGSKNVIACTANHFWLQRPDVAQKLNRMPKIALHDREVKTIAIYYYHFTTGGVQRVISLLAKMFVKMGYKVVIITDSETSDEDFPLPEGTVRTNIFNREGVNKDSVQQRLDAWDALMEQYRFDVVLYNAWTSNIMLWDFLYLKEAGIPVVVQAHSVFSFAVNKFQNLFPEIVRILPIADGLVVLSDADKAFWNAYADHVYMIPNPIAEELEGAINAKWDNKAIIWVGRVSNEKQPWAAFGIMEKVVRQIPDAKLYLLGNFDDPKWKKMAEDKGISANVVFCGMTQNVNEYYANASIHLSTSKYEGFLMTLLEAQAHGLPSVMFRMPHLTIGTPECGVIGVDMMDISGAANEIVRLLTDREHWQKNSSLARTSYEWLRNFDYETAWRRVLIGEQEPAEITKPVKDMIHTFVNHYSEGFKFQESQKKQMAVSYSDFDPVSYKIGRILTFIPRKIRGAIACCRENGLAYTMRLALKKAKAFIMRGD